MEGLPYQRDGFWKGIVQPLVPQNKQSNWKGQWLADGPLLEVFDLVCFVPDVVCLQTHDS